MKRNVEIDRRQAGAPVGGDTGWRARLGLVVLAFALAAVCLAQAGFSSWLQRVPVFGADRDMRWAAVYDRLPVVDVLKVKYGHALRHERFRYGLFGNSRAVGVSHRDLGLTESAFFNFAVGGTSFRQSVALVQMLYDAERLPDTVIISLDNHDISFFGHAEWPGLFAAPGYHATFLQLAYERQPSWVLMAKVVTETFLVSTRSIVTELNIAKLAGRWSFIFEIPSFGRASYDADGARVSGKTAVPTAELEFQKFTPLWPGMAVALEADIARLGRLAAAGVRIIVYESPIAPELADTVVAQRDAATVRLRQDFRAACATFGVTCLDAPMLAADPSWPDCCHAPPVSLGRYISDLL